MSGPIKHVGKVQDQRCVVVFMQIPGKEDHALVVMTDALPPRYEQTIIELVNSQEGQAENVFANLLGRRAFPDTGENVLEALHKMQALVPTPIDRIVMYPMPNQGIPLRTVLELIGGRVPPRPQTEVSTGDAENKYNPHGQIRQTENAENNRGTAENLLIEAELLEVEARRKREQAYKFAPSLRPNELAKLNVTAAGDVYVEVPKAKARAARKKT
jgi:hypothetical protein